MKVAIKIHEVDVPLWDAGLRPSTELRSSRRASFIYASGKKEIAMGTYGVGTEIHAVDTELRSSVRPSIFAILSYF